MEPVHVASDGDPQKLIENMVRIQLMHQEEASRIMHQKLNWVFQDIEQKLLDLEPYINLGDEDMNKRYKKIQRIYHRLTKYCNVLPIIGFNSQRYDLPLIKQYLPAALHKLDSLPQFVIHKDTSYMVIGTERLKYLDLTNYLAAGTSLSKFYDAYNCTNAKGQFPYEWFSSLEKLEYRGLPPQTCFESTLTKKGIDAYTYMTCWADWHIGGMTKFADFVKFYNNLDVIGLVEGIEKMLLINEKKQLNVFKDSVSLPGLTQRYIFRSLGEDYFTSFSETHAHIYKDLKNGIVGGPSLVFNRYQEAGVTKIKNNELCERAIGYDANSLYLNCTGLEQCTGPYRLREKSKQFKKHSKIRSEKEYLQYSQQAINWLNIVMAAERNFIRHAENHPHGEKRIENTYVDGYCEKTNTVYEFLGCYFHGHSCDPNNRHAEWENTLARLQKFRDLGYNVEPITSCEWEKYEMEVSGAPPVLTTEKDIQNGIISGEIFGIVKCDIKVPESLIDFFSPFPPIFKNTEIPLSEIGEHMQAYARSIQREKGVEKALISSMYGKDMILLTPLFKKYIQMGLICTNIEWVLEYHPKRVFEWFVDEVVQDRRMADLDKSFAIKGETSKTAGNCCYGKCCIDKSKHNTVCFCEEENLDRHIQDPLFKSMEELNDGIYEVVKGKRKVILDTPLQVGIAVYSYAKLSLLCFWEFLNKYLDNSLYCLMECDTDSLYIAIARPTLDDCVKPELKEEWNSKKYEFLADDSEDLMDFNGHTITRKQYGKRTPGMYKLEYSGIGMICLNSKVYHIWDADGRTKTACKGIQERRNTLEKEDFLRVLLEQKNDHKVENAGFIKDGLQTKTYTQWKKGLNYFYAKRIVLDDGITTTHLKI